jgi:enolase-phosphatase E1
VIHLAAAGIRVVLLDIEGTTTPLAFVQDVLFPFARRHLSDWLDEWRNTDTGREVERHLASEHANDLRRGERVPAWATAEPGRDRPGLEAYVLQLMDHDRKSPALKKLQGLIWEAGYQRGELRGLVYDDVAPALRRWRAHGLDAAIYSSGSELAQRRLFASTAEGDLTPLLVGFFDTSVGPKREAASYWRIASALGHRPDRILFVSDVAAELDAARDAGCATALCVRSGPAPAEDSGGHPVIRTLEDVR